MPKPDTGVLLINLGTPDRPAEREVRAYLKEFLSDPLVIDLPAPLRWLILRLFILPRRPKVSAAAYQKIWTPEGSPLLLHTRMLTEKVSRLFGEDLRVDFAMRYGNPSIRSSLDRMRSAGVQKLIAFPLFPQYSEAATRSAVEAFTDTLKRMGWFVPYQIAKPFYADPGFIQSFSRRVKPFLESKTPDHILFSFHGLPERHIRKTESEPGYCLRANPDCCAVMNEHNQHCYRAQCYATAYAMAESLSLSTEQYTVCFQSRLGGTPWIRPHTDRLITSLAESGHKKILIVCPAFVADCLETLEEINIRGRESFQAAGGSELIMAPSLNAGDDWAEAMCNLIKNAAKTTASPVKPQAFRR